MYTISASQFPFLNLKKAHLYTCTKAKIHRVALYTCTVWMNEWDFLPKTQSECLLISAAVCEAGAGGLGLADATAVVTPVDLWLVKAKHSLFVGQCYGKKTWKRKTEIGKCASTVDVSRQMCLLLLGRGRSLHAHILRYKQAILNL